MARTIALDNLVVRRMTVVRGAARGGGGGGLQIQCEYEVRSGTRVVQRKTARLSPQQVAGRQSALTGLLDGIVQELANAELA